MKVYKLKHDNGHRTTNTLNTLGEAEGVAIKYMGANSDVKVCEITLECGSLSIIRKEDGAKHWNHPGYTFSMVNWRDYAQYRKMQTK